MASEDKGLAVNPFAVGAVCLDSEEFASREGVVAAEKAGNEDFGFLVEDGFRGGWTVSGDEFFWGGFGIRDEDESNGCIFFGGGDVESVSG